LARRGGPLEGALGLGVGEAGSDHGKLTPLWLSYSRGNVARGSTEGSSKTGGDGPWVSQADEKRSRRHARGVRLRPYARGAPVGG
jgi:hypothetical protein